MADSKRSSSGSFALTEQEHGRSETWREKAARAQRVTQKESMHGYEVIFIVDENNTNQQAFDFALETAKNFNAKLVLVYSALRQAVPDGYLEFAKDEGLRDYEWQYYEDLASCRLERLCREATEAGIECTAQMHMGDVNSAISSFRGKSRSIVVLNAPARSSWFRRLVTRLFSNGATDSYVPVMVFLKDTSFVNTF